MLYMLLVSDYFLLYMPIESETRHLWTPAILGFPKKKELRVSICITCFLYLCYINQVHATRVWFNIDIYAYLNEIKLMKPVTCRYQLLTHSAWSMSQNISFVNDSVKCIPCDKCLVLTLTFTYILNEIKPMKPVTCCYQLLTHSHVTLCSNKLIQTQWNFCKGRHFRNNKLFISLFLEDSLT